jgi:hypothetical protein
MQYDLAVSDRCLMDFFRKLTKNFSDHTGGILRSGDDLMRFALGDSTPMNGTSVLSGKFL